MSPVEPTPGRVHAPAWTIDAALTAAVIIAAFVGNGFGAGDHATPGRRIVAVCLLGPQTLPLLLRRRWPGAVLVVVAGAMAVRLWLGLPVTVAGLGVAAAVYSVGLYGTLRTRLLAWALTVAVGVTGLVAFLLASGSYRLLSLVLPAMAFPAALFVGDYLRTRRAYLATLEERAAMLEREREDQARAAVLAERARIARELHDVLAHHISAIAVQAQAAGYATDTATLNRALGDIQSASDHVLTELRQLLGLLHPEPAALAPPPGLAQLDDLLTATRAAGLSVQLHINGQPAALPEALDLSAYRILQEALTNVRRHAQARQVHVTIDYHHGQLQLTVVDDGRGPAPGAVPGRGDVGMRERVALFGGTYQAGPAPGGGYQIHAALPIGNGPAPTADTAARPASQAAV